MIGDTASAMSTWQSGMLSFVVALAAATSRGMTEARTKTQIRIAKTINIFAIDMLRATFRQGPSTDIIEQGMCQRFEQ
jgi:hypothetical protein